MSLICHIAYIKNPSLKLTFGESEITANVQFQCTVNPQLAHDLTEMLKMPCAVVFHGLQAKFPGEGEKEVSHE